MLSVCMNLMRNNRLSYVATMEPFILQKNRSIRLLLFLSFTTFKYGLSTCEGGFWISCAIYMKCRRMIVRTPALSIISAHASTFLLRSADVRFLNNKSRMVLVPGCPDKLPEQPGLISSLPSESLRNNHYFQAVTGGDIIKTLIKSLIIYQKKYVST